MEGVVRDQVGSCMYNIQSNFTSFFFQATGTGCSTLLTVELVAIYIAIYM